MFKEIHEQKKREKYIETLKLASIVQAEGSEISPGGMEDYRSGIANTIPQRASSTDNVIGNKSQKPNLDIFKKGSHSSNDVVQAGGTNQKGVSLVNDIIHEEDENQSSDSHSLRDSQTKGGFDQKLENEQDQDGDDNNNIFNLKAD